MMGLKLRLNGVEIEWEGEWKEYGPGHFSFRPANKENLVIAGCDMHVEAVEVFDDPEGVREAASPDCDETLDGLYMISDMCKHDTIEIDGRVCEVYAVPAGQ